MNITEFLQQSSGKWFSQRTSHYFASKQSKSGKSDIQIELLPKDADKVIQLCNASNVDPSLALCGVRATWSSAKDWDSEKNAGSTVLVPLANSNNANEGDLLGLGDAQHKLIAGRYSMGSDDALTLTAEYETEHGTVHSEERLWFASPNLRLRTSTLKRTDGFGMASFCSEIRMGGGQPPAQATPSKAP